MMVETATEASEVVRDFLEEMGWSVFSSPLRASKRKGKWIVEFAVGYKIMRFVIDASTGKILKYGTIKE